MIVPLELTYQMSWVINLPMRPELSLDVLVSKQSHLSRQMLAMSTEESSIQGNRRKKGHRVWLQTALGVGG